ncbi:hypothetical protein NXH67_04330 [Butyrivibrio sp. DSM 10294]|uniref:hypothetical protein n=1 Tax=Butyrivibrio sp. DSM 10294 TaxID=2972457 RepID=UPI00234E6547|nr:hypothetical protein [Butyrivibrio sp. DSM 10294]MDC7292739.1 hypothetical protein [Butyrivibrio sp. DSM 10294]
MKKVTRDVKRTFCALLSVLTIAASIPQTVLASETGTDYYEETLDEEVLDEAVLNEEEPYEEESSYEEVTDEETSYDDETNEEEVSPEEAYEAEPYEVDPSEAESSEAELAETTIESSYEVTFPTDKMTVDIAESTGIISVNGKVYLDPVKVKDYACVICRFNVNKAYRVDPDNTAVDFIYQGQKETILPESESVLSVSYDENNNMLDVYFNFTFDEAGNLMTGSLDIKPCFESVLSNNTFVWTGKMDLETSGDSATSGIGSTDGKNYYLINNATAINAFFYVNRGMEIRYSADGKLDVSVTFNGKELSEDDDEYYCNYNYDLSTLEVYITIPADEQGNPLKGNVVITAGTVSAQSKYSFKYSGKMTLIDDKGTMRTGIGSSNGKDYYILNNTDKVEATFLVDASAMLEKDAEGNYKVTATYNNKAVSMDSGQFFYSYNSTDRLLYICFYFPLDKSGLPAPGNLSISATTIAKYTFTFSGKCGNTTVMSPDTSDDKNFYGLTTDNGKYYFDNETDAISATFKIAPGYIVDTDANNVPKVKLTVGGKEITESGYETSYSVNIYENTVSFYSPIAFQIKDSEKSVMGNIALSITFVTLKSAYTLTYDSKLVPDTSDVDSIKGLIYDGGKYYISREADEVAMNFKVKEGYFIQEYDPDDYDHSGYKIKVTVGGKVSEEACVSYSESDQTVCFSFNIPYDDNGKRQLGNIVITPTFGAYKKATFVCDFSQIEYINCSGAEDITADNKVTTFKPGDPFWFLVETVPGYEVKKVTNGKTVLKSDSKYSYNYEIANAKDNLTITITTGKWTGKELNPIPVNLSVNGDVPSKSTATVTFTGGVTYDKSKKQYYTEKTVYGRAKNITFTVEPAAGLEIDGDTSIISCDGDILWASVSVDNSEISIYSDDVAAAMEKKKPINISLNLRKRSYNVRFLTYDCDEGVIFSEYEVGKGPKDDLIDYYDRFRVSEGESFTFIAGLWQDYGVYYEIDSVTCNGKELKPKSDNGTTYYSIDNISEDCEIRATKREIVRKCQVTVNTDTGIKDVKAVVDGTTYSKKGNNSSFSFEVEQGKTVSLEIAAKNNYEIGKVLKDGYIDLDVANGKTSFEVDDDTNISITSTGIPVMSLKNLTNNNSITYPKNGDLISVDYLDKYELRVKCGDEELAINSLRVFGGDKKEEFATLSEDGKTVQISCDKAEGITDVISVNLSCDSVLEDMNLRFTVDQPIKSVALKGAKKNILSQPAGTARTYAVTLNKGADYDAVKVAAASESDKNATVTYDPENKTVTVESYKGNLLPKSDVILVFKDKKNRQVGEPFTVKVTSPKIAAPTVKTVITSDIDITLKVTAPKAADYRNVYVKISAEAVTSKKKPLAENMSASLTRIIKTDDLVAAQGIVKLNLAGKGVKAGSGAAQKYAIRVSMIQLDNTAAYNASGVAEDKILTTGKIKKVSAATKTPAYEKKLTVKAGKKAFTRGEKDINVATYTFSKATTFRTIDKVTLTGSLKNDTYTLTDKKNVVKLLDDGKTIAIADSSKLYPGTYVLTAYPLGEGKPGTLKFTVKAPVTQIVLDAPADKIVKAPKKAASIKLTTTCKSVIAGEEYKPANTKVSVTITSENPELQKCLTYKSGKITVSKKYVPDENPANNTFTVTVTAKDLAGKGTPATASKTFTITN